MGISLPGDLYFRLVLVRGQVGAAQSHVRFCEFQGWGNKKAQPKLCIDSYILEPKAMSKPGPEAHRP